MKQAHLMPISDEVMARWQEYVEARARCEAQPTIQHGIAAGKAWARWLELFEGKAHV